MLRDVPSPGLTPGMVRIRMLASPINPSDLMTVRGIYGKKPALPVVPGYEGVGVVTAANAGFYGNYLMGKRVAVLNSHGGNWAEEVLLPAKQAVPLDARLTLEQAATFFVNPAAAFIMTRRLLAVPRRQWLLQSAAGSALGKMVIRLGKRFHFDTVNIVRRSEQVDELKKLGANEVVVFDGDREEPGVLRDRLAAILAMEEVEEFGGDHYQEQGPFDGVTYAIDPVGGKTASAMVRCLGPNGRLMLYGTLSAEPISFSPRDLMSVGARVEGFWLSNYMNSLGLLGKLGLIRSISRLILDGVLTSDIGETFPLEKISEAVRAAESPGKAGKVLLRISST